MKLSNAYNSKKRKGSNWKADLHAKYSYGPLKVQGNLAYESVSTQTANTNTIQALFSSSPSDITLKRLTFNYDKQTTPKDETLDFHTYQQFSGILRNNVAGLVGVSGTTAASFENQTDNRLLHRSLIKPFILGGEAPATGFLSDRQNPYTFGVGVNTISLFDVAPESRATHSSWIGSGVELGNQEIGNRLLYIKGIDETITLGNFSNSAATCHIFWYICKKTCNQTPFEMYQDYINTTNWNQSTFAPAALNQRAST